MTSNNYYFKSVWTLFCLGIQKTFAKTNEELLYDTEERAKIFQKINNLFSCTSSWSSSSVKLLMLG